MTAPKSRGGPTSPRRAKSRGPERIRSYHKGNVREDLIAHAEKILKDEGLDAVTLRRLAREVGVVPSAVYNHFRDHETLLASIAADGFRKLRVARTSARDPNDTFEQALRRASRDDVIFACKNPNLFKLMFSFSFPEQHRYPELLEEAGKAFEVGVREWYGDVEFSVETSSKQYPAVLSVWGLMHGITLLLLDRMITLEKYDEKSIGEVVDVTLDVLIDGARRLFPKTQPPPRRVRRATAKRKVATR
jgi:AcrR family transcriptional regulator